MTIQVEIVTPSRQLYSGAVQMVTLPGGRGRDGRIGWPCPPSDDAEYR